MDTDKTASGRGSGSRFLRYRVSGLVLAGLMLALVFSGSCKGGSGEDAKAQAINEIKDSLLLPPDCKLRNTEIKQEQNTLLFNFGTNRDVDELENFYKEQVFQRAYEIAAQSPAAISYQDQNRRQITVMWFARDPDISEFKTVFYVGVNPLPPNLKEKTK